MKLHKDDYFLILSDLCGAIYVMAGMAMGVDPLYISLLLAGKIAEMYIRYRRYDPSINKYRFKLWATGGVL
jgi:hypothetical protein